MIKLNYSYKSFDEFYEKFLEFIQLKLGIKLSPKETQVVSKLYYYMKIHKLKRIDKFTKKYVCNELSITSQNLNNIIGSLKSKQIINEFLELSNNLSLPSNKITFNIELEFIYEQTNK